MSRPIIHLICQAHLDPVWLWEWEEGAAEVISTFRTAADLCEQSDGFVFNHNEVVLYEWVEEYEPSLFERIRALVRDGRWHIMGGWFLQPDCNMPSGESFVRQILAGRRYFAEKFGVRPTTAINFDPFGHSRGLVQILAKCGYDSYLFCRPNAPRIPFPGESFVWVGYDGSEVVGRRVLSWYNSPLGGAADKVRRLLPEVVKETPGIILWGVGNHGGGPSRKDVADLGELIAATAEADIRHSTPEEYFAGLAAHAESLPRHKHGLNPWGVGCYTSMCRVKQKHRLLENTLYSTEKMLAAACLNGLMDYPRERLSEALHDLLLAEFHDILPGSSVQPVEETSLRLLDHGLEVLSRVRAAAFFALAAGQPKAADGEIPVLVYNPHPYAVTDVVSCEFQLADANWGETYTLPSVFRDGVSVPSQIEKEVSNMALDWRKRVVFRTNLEPGMNRFDCRMQVLDKAPELPPCPADTIEFTGASVTATVDRRTGRLSSLALEGAEFLGKDAFRLLVIRDNEDPWGMTSDRFRDVEGEFTLMSPERGTEFSGVTRGVIPSCRIIEDGPVRTVVESVVEFAHSAACIRYMLPKTGTDVDVEVRVFWNEKSRMLKLSIPCAFDGTYLGQTAFGFEALPGDGAEAVAQKWTAVRDTASERVLLCLNDGVYGSDFKDSEIRMTLLRSPSYAGHPIGDRPVVKQDRFTPRIDQGERIFRFRIRPVAGPTPLASADREGLTFNERPFALSFFPGGFGTKPVRPVLIEGEAVVMTALKPAEDAPGWVLRLAEPSGCERDATVVFPMCNVRQPAHFAPYEVKTWIVRPETGAMTETNLIEEAPGTGN